MGEGWTGGASDIVQAKSSGEDPRATGGLVSNLSHSRVNTTKQHCNTHTLKQTNKQTKDSERWKRREAFIIGSMSVTVVCPNVPQISALHCVAFNKIDPNYMDFDRLFVDLGQHFCILFWPLPLHFTRIFRKGRVFSSLWLVIQTQWWYWHFLCTDISFQRPVARFSLDLWMSFCCRSMGAPIPMLHDDDCCYHYQTWFCTLDWGKVIWDYQWFFGRFAFNFFAFRFSEGKICSRKKQLIQDLIPPPSGR